MTVLSSKDAGRHHTGSVLYHTRVGKKRLGLVWAPSFLSCGLDNHRGPCSTMLTTQLNSSTAEHIIVYYHACLDLHHQHEVGKWSIASRMAFSIASSALFCSCQRRISFDRACNHACRCCF